MSVVKEDINEISKLIDRVNFCAGSIAVISSKKGLRKFEEWENKNLDYVLKKIELPDSYNGFLCNNDIYLIPLPIESNNNESLFWDENDD